MFIHMFMLMSYVYACVDVICLCSCYMFRDMLNVCAFYRLIFMFLIWNVLSTTQMWKVGCRVRQADRRGTLCRVLPQVRERDIRSYLFRGLR